MTGKRKRRKGCCRGIDRISKTVILAVLLSHGRCILARSIAEMDIQFVIYFLAFG
jgi:hypothetical protein